MLSSGDVYFDITVSFAQLRKLRPGGHEIRTSDGGAEKIDPPDEHEPSPKGSENAAAAGSVGFPGRPSVMAAVKNEMERRAATVPPMLESTLAAEADALESWAKILMPNAQTPKSKSIKNALRSTYGHLKATLAQSEKARN